MSILLKKILKDWLKVLSRILLRDLLKVFSRRTFSSDFFARNFSW